MIQEVLIEDYLFGILTVPKVYNKKIPIILFLHGFGTDKNEVGNTFLIAANKLYKEQIASLRIDFSGCGESKGLIADITIEQLIADAGKALNFIMQQDFVDVNCIGLCGFSLGAGISILVANHYDIKSMALLSPAGNLPEDFNEYFGFNDYNRVEKSNDALELDLGWRKVKLRNNFIHSLKRHFLMESISSYKCSFFVVAGTNDFSYKHANAYMTKVTTTNKRIHIVDDGDHIFHADDKEKSAINEVTEQITTWFKKTLS
jgi:hypothetical protein